MLCCITFGLHEGPAKAKPLDTVMNIYIKTLTDDDDKEVVAQACIGITEIVNASLALWLQNPELLWPQSPTPNLLIKNPLQLSLGENQEVRRKALKSTLILSC